MSPTYAGKLIHISAIDRFWLSAATYHGVNFFVMSWRGPKGKPHLKACRADQ